DRQCHLHDRPTLHPPGRAIYLARDPARAAALRGAVARGTERGCLTSHLHCGEILVPRYRGFIGWWLPGDRGHARWRRGSGLAARPLTTASQLTGGATPATTRRSIH